MQPENIFKTPGPHAAYVTTESGEIGSLLQGLGFVYSGHNSGSYLYFLGSVDHGITASVFDLGLQESIEKQREIGFYPQARIAFNGNNNQKTYERSALKVVASLRGHGYWFALCGIGEPYVYKEDPLESSNSFPVIHLLG